MAKQIKANSVAPAHQQASHLEDIVADVFKHQPELQKKVDGNPDFYRPLLESTAAQLYEKYRGPIYWGKAIDKIDRLTSAVGIASDLFPVTMGTVSAGEDLLELVPKGIYGAYYLYKTGDYKAIPGWIAHEALSFIPLVGDLLDMRNIYVNRARKRFALAVRRKFENDLASMPRQSA